MGLIAAAIERLRQMFDVVCYSTQRFELAEIGEHLRRIYDLMLSSNMHEVFSQILDLPDDMKISPIKLEVLKLIAQMSVGNRLFSQGSEISINVLNEEGDVLMLQKIQAMMLNLDMIVKVVNQINSNCIEVRDQSFLVIGQLIRNGVDIQSLIFDSDALEVILQQIYP